MIQNQRIQIISESRQGQSAGPLLLLQIRTWNPYGSM